MLQVQTRRRFKWKGNLRATLLGRAWRLVVRCDDRGVEKGMERKEDFIGIDVWQESDSRGHF